MNKKLNLIADKIANFLGSWHFVIGQSIIFSIWIVANALNIWYEWDPYPFVFLNLFMSAEAAYATPLILMSQSRQAQTDRQTLEDDLALDQESAQHLVEIRLTLQRLEERLNESP